MASYTPQGLHDYIEKHGGVVKSEPIVQKDKNGEPLSATDSQYRLELKHTLGDGTILAVIFDQSAGPSGGWVVDPSESKTLKADQPGSNVPKTTAPGNPNEQWLAQTDPQTGEITWIPNKNYVAPTPTKQPADRAVGGNTTEQFIVSQAADGSLTSMPNPNYVPPGNNAEPIIPIYDPSTGQIRQGTKSEADALAKQAVARIDLLEGSDAEKQAALDAWWRDTFTIPKAKMDAQSALDRAGQDAGTYAVNLAKAGTEHQVGPGYGQHFADTLNSMKNGGSTTSNFTGSDFTVPTPDYQTIARNATAAALAHLSPYAAEILGAQGPSTYVDPAARSNPAAAVATSPAVATVAPQTYPLAPGSPYRPGR